METTLLTIAATTLGCGVSFLAGMALRAYQDRIAIRRTLKREAESVDADTLKAREVIDNIAARRFPSLAGR